MVSTALVSNTGEHYILACTHYIHVSYGVVQDVTLNPNAELRWSGVHILVGLSSRLSKENVIYMWLRVSKSEV